jgi:hypothetical protein
MSAIDISSSSLMESINKKLEKLFARDNISSKETKSA